MKKKALSVVLSHLLWLSAFSAYAVLAAPTNDSAGENTPLEVPTEGLAFKTARFTAYEKRISKQAIPAKTISFYP